MKTPTIAQVLGLAPGEPAPVMAMAPEYGRGLLASALPDQLAEGPTASLGVPRGERYALTRGVAVVPVRGVLTPNSEILEKYLGWTTYYGLADTLSDLADRQDVASVILDIDSPGGLVIGLDIAVQGVAKLAASKPVHALASPLSASAAYWIASQAKDIAAVPGAVVGSIGVRGQYCWPVGPDDDGDQTVIFTSSHARAKAPDPTSEKGQALIMQDLDWIEADFLEDVAAGRGIALADLPARLSKTDDPADGGGCFFAEEALTRGLIDTIETCEAFYTRILDAHAPAPKRGQSRAFSALAAAAQAAAAL